MSGPPQASRVTLPPLAAMDAHQRAVHDQAVAFFGAPTGPRIAMIDTPEVGEAWTGLAKALAKSALSAALRELTILVVARLWDSQFAWWAHERRALEAGLSPDTIAAIKGGQIPDFTREDEAATYAYVTELCRDHRVGDATYMRLRDCIGSRVLVELTVLTGHYTNVAMTLAAHAVPLPPGIVPPLPALAPDRT